MAVAVLLPKCTPVGYCPTCDADRSIRESDGTCDGCRTKIARGHRGPYTGAGRQSRRATDVRWRSIETRSWLIESDEWRAALFAGGPCPRELMPAREAALVVVLLGLDACELRRLSDGRPA